MFMKPRNCALPVMAMLMTVAGQIHAQDDTCAPVDGFGFICGMERPEDLKLIPGTRWLISSGFREGSGLKLVDTADKTMQPWWRGTADQIGTVSAEFPSCDGAPDVQTFNVQGLSLRTSATNRYRLYAVNHGGRESVEVFDVNVNDVEPGLHWVGCVKLPEGLSGNAVAAFADGSLLVTVLLHPGKTLADQVQGQVTGGVYQWQAGATGFRLLPGTELPGNNGIETALDGDEFYVISFGLKTVFVFNRYQSEQPLRQMTMPDFMPDNLQWTPLGDDARLLLAGMMYDEPACGGRRKIFDGVADGMRCPRGYRVAELDPENMSLTMVDYGEPNPVFNGVSSAVIVGDEIWLGSYQADRLAYRPLPALRGR